LYNEVVKDVAVHASKYSSLKFWEVYVMLALPSGNHFIKRAEQGYAEAKINFKKP
jgi:hypothetical protein